MSHSPSEHQKPRALQPRISQPDGASLYLPQLTRHIRIPGCKQHCTSTVVQDARVFTNSVGAESRTAVALNLRFSAGTTKSNKHLVGAEAQTHPTIWMCNLYEMLLLQDWEAVLKVTDTELSLVLEETNYSRWRMTILGSKPMPDTLLIVHGKSNGIRRNRIQKLIDLRLSKSPTAFYVTLLTGKPASVQECWPPPSIELRDRQEHCHLRK